MIGKELLTDNVYIISKDGTKQGAFKTRFGTGDKLTLFDSNLEMDIEVGYQILRPLPNGKEMIYTVKEYNFQDKFHDIPPQHILKLSTNGMPKEPKTPVSKTVVNIHNSSGVQVGDNNIQNITNSFNELIERINSCDASVEEKAQAKGAIKALLENPTVSSILGGAVSGLIPLLLV